MRPSVEAPLERADQPPLLIVSNRLPIVLRRRGNDWHREPGSGGLVTALEPALRRRGGTWVGWPGVLEEEGVDLHELLRRDSSQDGFTVEPVPLTAAEVRDFYLGFSNETLWPLFHGLLDRCRFEPEYRNTYRQVNRKFAQVTLRVARPEQFVWVHDYHLMAVGEELKAAGCRNRVGFFLHIPFPPPDLFERLPWGRELLAALLHYDMVGFQTRRDRRNFLSCVELLRPLESKVHGDVVLWRKSPERATRVGVHPISIDLSLFTDDARTEEVGARAAQLRTRFGVERLLLGVDRLDYTKGIPQKLLGLERALEKHSDLIGRVKLVQLVIPSREEIPEYQCVRDQIERLVSRINARFGEGGWVPVHYEFASWPRSELLAFYRAADAALVTPLRDGMNLVAKEYVAASSERGALILSAFAGSADELGSGALLVNPHDVEGLAEAIHHSLTMPQDEQLERLTAMRERLQQHDIHAWVRDFLEEAAQDADAEEEVRRTWAGWTSASLAATRRETTRVGRSIRPHPPLLPAHGAPTALGPEVASP